MIIGCWRPVVFVAHSQHWPAVRVLKAHLRFVERVAVHSMRSAMFLITNVSHIGGFLGTVSMKPTLASQYRNANRE